MVRVGLQTALGDVERGLGHNLVERVRAAPEVLARVAVAMKKGEHVSSRRMGTAARRRSSAGCEVWRESPSTQKKKLRHIPKNMALLLLVELDGPFRLAAVAVSVVGCHDDWLCLDSIGFAFLSCNS